MNKYLIGNGSRPGWLWPVPEKILLIMRLTTLLLVISFVHVSGKVLSQITLNESNAKLETVLKAIEKQSGYVFVYNADKVNLDNVTVSLKNATIEQALEACFKNTQIQYQIVSKNIVLRRREVVPEKPIASEPILILGTVINTSRQPLSGASVIVKRTKKGVSTDAQGKYLIKTAEITDTLLFSYLGYVTKAIPARVAAKSPILDVIMEEATNGLDEIVIQGYGKTSKRLATGDITRVSGKDISDQPVMNPILALQGRVANVDITPVSGTASGPVKIEIRGRKALNDQFPSDPLYIINGVPLTVLEVRGGTANAGSAAYSRGYDQTGAGPGQSPFFSLNPDDIESIEILKDADATAIYGSRGANGVILITTKKGQPGKMKIDASFNTGSNFVTRYFDLLNTQQYIAMRKEAFANSGVQPTVNNAVDLLVFDQSKDTNWQKYHSGSSSQTNYTGSVSGGSELTTYRIGASYGTTHDLSTITGGNRRGTVSLSLQNHSADQKFSMDLNASYAATSVDAVQMDIPLTLPPNAPDPFDSQGNLNFAAWGAAHANYPFNALKNTSDQRGNTLSSGLLLTYNVVKGLSLSTSLGYTNTTNLNTVLNPIASLDPFGTPPFYGKSQFGTTRVSNMIVEPQLNYHTLLGKGSLAVLAGGTYQQNSTSGANVRGSNYTDDALLGTITNAPVVTADDISGKYKYTGVFARVNFNWDGKYILNLNGRRDGSSRFGADSRFGNFYSIGAAWNISDEKWVSDFLPSFFSLVKIRGSYGITGSDQVGDYKYLTQYGNTAIKLPDYNGISPIIPLIQPNADYHWQVNRSTELALEIGMLKDRLSLSVSAYRSYCDNQLVDFLTPAITGFTSVIANSPAKVANDGLEIALNGTLIKTNKFSWSASFNTGFNRNRLLAYPNLEKSPYADRLKIGTSVNSVYVLKYLGVDPLTGYYTFEDHNGDNNITTTGGPESRGDRYIAVKTTPDFTGNLSQTFRYKGFSLSANFYLVKQRGRNSLYNNTAIGSTNISLERYLTRWQKPGDQALTAKLSVVTTAENSLILQSDQAYTDASFIRLNSINASGALPKSWAKQIGASNINFMASASNIFVITKYKGLDPVIQSVGSALPSRTITFGLNCSF